MQIIIVTLQVRISLCITERKPNTFTLTGTALLHRWLIYNVHTVHCNQYVCLDGVLDFSV